MRQSIKFLHTMGSCGLIGALLAYAAILAAAPQATAQSYADMRQAVAAVSNYVLLPSLALSLLTGLVSMMVHKPFAATRWAWLKAALGLSMFEATLAIVQAKAASAAAAAAEIAAGGGDPDALASLISSERATIVVILALSSAQVALGVWRPLLAGRVRRRPAKAEPARDPA